MAKMINPDVNVPHPFKPDRINGEAVILCKICGEFYDDERHHTGSWLADPEKDKSEYDRGYNDGYADGLANESEK